MANRRDQERKASYAEVSLRNLPVLCGAAVKKIPELPDLYILCDAALHIRHFDAFARHEIQPLLFDIQYSATLRQTIAR